MKYADTIQQHKKYIGNIGWSTNTKHIIDITECDCDNFEGVHMHSDPRAFCKPNLGQHYRIGPVTQVKHVAPTLENITCKACKKLYKPFNS